MRGKKTPLTRTVRNITTHIAVVLGSVVLAFLPCASFSAYGLTGRYEKDRNYPIWDDPNGSYSYYWEDVARKVTSVTRTYDDGTKYTASYQYNAQGNMTDATIKEADGSKITIKRVFSGNRLLSSTLNEYDGLEKSQFLYLTEYGEDENPTHELSKVTYSDQTVESEEMWYTMNRMPLKTIEVSRKGVTRQTEYAYDEWGNTRSMKSSGTDGGEQWCEWTYNDSAALTHYKGYDYYVDANLKKTEEFWLEGSSDSAIEHTLVTTIVGDTEETKVETWRRAKDDNVTKVITTLADGAQITEEFTYNLDGDETLYTKRGGQAEERRETVRGKDETTTTYTDGLGNRIVSKQYYDIVNDIQTDEQTSTYADGSSSYTKESYQYKTGRRVLDISRYKEADGTETYRESVSDGDGVTTTKEKTADGRVSTTKTDSEGNIISRNMTFSDGTTADTSKEYREDGLVASETTRYSDGTEDRITYEYDENGEVIKQTESRRNGVSAVSQMKQGDNPNWKDGSVTFNNGYWMTWSWRLTDQLEGEIVISYSHGDVSQDALILVKDTIKGNITYRDGRVETFLVDEGDSDSEAAQLAYTKMMEMNSRLEAFEETAFLVLPNESL